MRNSHFRGALIALAICAAAPMAAWGQDGATTTASETSETKLDLARQIVDIGAPEATREKMFFSAIDQLTVQMRASMLKAVGPTDEGAIRIVDHWLVDWIEGGKGVLRLHIPAIVDGWASAYADMFTTQELEDILAFVSTPSGQVFFQRSSEIASNPHFAAANQAYMDEVMARLPEAQARLRAELEAYLIESQETEPSGI